MAETGPMIHWLIIAEATPYCLGLWLWSHKKFMSSKAKDIFKKLVNCNCITWADWLLLGQIRFHSVGWFSSMFRNWASNPLKILSTERFKSSVCKTVRCPFASIYWLFYLKLPHFLSREGEKTRSDRFSCNKDFQCRGAVKTFVGNILH